MGMCKDVSKVDDVNSRIILPSAHQSPLALLCTLTTVVVAVVVVVAVLEPLRAMLVVT